jgi:hypothetical protein
VANRSQHRKRHKSADAGGWIASHVGDIPGEPDLINAIIGVDVGEYRVECDRVGMKISEMIATRICFPNWNGWFRPSSSHDMVPQPSRLANTID